MNTTRAVTIALAILGLVMGSPFRMGLAAQAEATEAEGNAGRGFFQAGYIRLDIDELNDELVLGGLPSMGENYLTLGGAGYGARGRFLIGGEGHALLGGSESAVGGARKLTVSGGYGMFRVGYLVLTRDALDVFPLFGIGGGGMGLKIAERSAPTFDQVINDPETSSTLSTGVFLLDVGAAANYRLTMSERENGVGGLLLGVQVGYSFAPAQSAWNLDGTNDVAGGPDLRIQGPYVRLSIGGWGRQDPEDAEAGDAR
jgi:hypothetical protein